MVYTSSAQPPAHRSNVVHGAVSSSLLGSGGAVATLITIPLLPDFQMHAELGRLDMMALPQCIGLLHARSSGINLACSWIQVHAVGPVYSWMWVHGVGPVCEAGSRRMGLTGIQPDPMHGIRLPCRIVPMEQPHVLILCEIWSLI